MSELRACFDEALHLTGSVCPENSLYFVALGAAHHARSEAGSARRMLWKPSRRSTARRATTPCRRSSGMRTSWPPSARAMPRRRSKRRDPAAYAGDAYLGIDSGSHHHQIRRHRPRRGAAAVPATRAPTAAIPCPIVRELPDDDLRTEHGRIGRSRGSAVTGYGEDLIRSAFGVDYRPGRDRWRTSPPRARSCPNVDFIIDIGGQDIKCFKIRNGAIDNIMLNEACSSGCGSFIADVRQRTGLQDRGFRQAGPVRAQAPVDLGSPLHGVHEFLGQAGAEGRRDDVSDISAGLSITRRQKRALQGHPRSGSAEELGEHIVVQGGTFLNDAVLRAFERETGRGRRPPGHRGADGRLRRGAARHGTVRAARGREHRAQPRGAEGLHPQRQAGASAACCENHCRLTVNDFRRRPPVHLRQPLRAGAVAGGKAEHELPNLYEYKQRKAAGAHQRPPARTRRAARSACRWGSTCMSLLPFWHALFHAIWALRWRVSGRPSSRKL